VVGTVRRSGTALRVTICAQHDCGHTTCTRPHGDMVHLHSTESGCVEGVHRRKRTGEKGRQAGAPLHRAKRGLGTGDRPAAPHRDPAPAPQPVTRCMPGFVPHRYLDQWLVRSPRPRADTHAGQSPPPLHLDSTVLRSTWDPDPTATCGKRPYFLSQQTERFFVLGKNLHVTRA